MSWTKDYERRVLEVLKSEKSGQTEMRDVYHIRKTFSLCTFMDVERCVRKATGKTMIVPERMKEAICTTHQATGR